LATHEGQPYVLLHVLLHVPLEAQLFFEKNAAPVTCNTRQYLIKLGMAQMQNYKAAAPARWQCVHACTFAGNHSTISCKGSCMHCHLAGVAAFSAAEQASLHQQAGIFVCQAAVLSTVHPL
jgi:hypothetical protein